jgi:molybdate transport system substrate-binding protein
MRPLKLLSSMATRELLAKLSAQYERSHAKPVVTEAAGGVDVAKRVQGGEPVDVVVLASNVIDKLISEGKLLGASRLDLVKSGVAIAVRAGAARPHIATEDEVKQAVRAAKSLCYSTGPSGVHLEKTFERWGVLAEIRTRIIVAPPGIPVGTLLARGEAELGFQQLSELKNVAGVEVLGPLPDAIQTITIFSGGIGAHSSEPRAARALLEYLAAPEATAIKRSFGMEPA